MSAQQKTTTARPIWSEEDRERMVKIVKQFSNDKDNHPVWESVAVAFPGHSINFVRQKFGSTARLLSKTDEVVRQSLISAREYKKTVTAQRPKKVRKVTPNSKKLEKMEAQLQRLTAEVKAMKSGTPKSGAPKKPRPSKARPQSGPEDVSRKLFTPK